MPSASGTSINTIFENAAAAKSSGVELEASLRPVHGLKISVAGGYLDAKFEDYLSSNPLELNQTPPSPTLSLRGKRLVQAPKWTTNLRASYEAEMEDGATLTFAGDLDYKSKIYFTPFNDERVSQSGRTLLNGSITYALPNDISISVWEKNPKKTYFATNYVIPTSGLIWPPMRRRAPMASRWDTRSSAPAPPGWRFHPSGARQVRRTL